MKNMNKVENIKVSVGIPAYNESANIKKLLDSLLLQNEAGFELLEIIVVSDGSSDDTLMHVLDSGSKKIKLVEHKLRQGKSACVNEIMQLFKGDVLILVDADIKIHDRYLFAKIIDENNISTAGLIGINAMPERAGNFIQKILEAGHLTMRALASSWNKGQNYLSFKGCFLCLSKEFAKSANMPNSVVNNDAYLYLRSKELGYSPAFYKNGKVYFTSPRTISDHMKQTERFGFSQKELQHYFSFDLTSEYAIPYLAYVKTFMGQMIQNPFYFLGYVALKAITVLHRPRSVSPKWSIALSTKK
jgi:peptidoglycan-N-acetylglucosamine deacetylase